LKVSAKGFVPKSKVNVKAEDQFMSLGDSFAGDGGKKKKKGANAVAKQPT
jgi:hypothetical protein